MEDKQIVEGARLSGSGHAEGTLVEITADIFPHVKGEKKRLDKDELERIAKVAKARKMESKGYRKYEFTDADKEAAKRDAAAAEARLAKAAEGVTV